jgi:hypothetical protein
MGMGWCQREYYLFWVIFDTIITNNTLPKEGDVIMNVQRVNYNDIAQQLQTGDLLFCHGLFQEALEVEVVEGSIWSHMGMVVRLPDYDELLLWESTTTETLKDVELHKIKTGPMLVSLRDRLITDVNEQYDALFAFRMLEAPRAEDTNHKLQQFIEEVHGASFPSMTRMALELLEGKLNIQAGYSNFFCSELVAETYMRLGLMDRSRASNSFEPKDFADGRSLPLVEGCQLGNVLYQLSDAAAASA